MVAATVSVAAVTYSTVPGELLYPLKRAAESTLLTLTTSDAERTDRQMTVARSRASEAAELLKAATPDSEELLGQTLEDMETTTRAALERVKQPTKPPAKVRRFARDQKKVVEKMVPKLGAENREIADAVPVPHLRLRRGGRPTSAVHARATGRWNPSG